MRVAVECNCNSFIPYACGPLFCKYISVSYVGRRWENQASRCLLCLHGFQTSGSFMCKQISKWDPFIFQRRFASHLLFMSVQNIKLYILKKITENNAWIEPAGFPGRGKLDIQGIFLPPYFQWFQFYEVNSHY